MELAIYESIPVKYFDGHVLDALANGGKHRGVAAYISIDDEDHSTLTGILDHVARPRLIILDGITDSGNLGACFRVAEAFSVNAIITTKKNSATLTPGAFAASSGSADRVPFFRVPNLVRIINKIKEKNIQVLGFSNKAKVSIFNINVSGGAAFVFGSEGEGVRPQVLKVCDQVVGIPMSGKVESLNVAVTVGITMFEMQRQFS